MDGAAGHARRARDLPVLRRRDDHAGDLGAVGGRGTDRHRSRARAARHPDRDRHSHRAVPRPVARHGQGRDRLRAGDPGLFRGAGGAWRDQHHGPSGDRRGARSVLGVQFLPLQSQACVPRPGLGLPGRDGRRNALRRHGPFRPQGDRFFLADPRLSLPHAQLHGPGRAAARRSGGGAESLLPDGAGMGAAAASLHCHGGDDHRQPGGHFGRLLGHPPGGSARFPAAPEDRAYERKGGGADLHPGGQLGPDGDGDRAGAGLPRIRPAWRRPMESR